MAATSAGALKAYIERGGFGLQAFRSRPVADAPLPYVTVQEALSVTPVADGHGGARHGNRRSVTEQVQVSLWQRLRTDGALPGEDYFLPAALEDYLDGATLPDAPTRVFGVTITQSNRQEDPNGVNVVQHAITVNIHRERVPR